MFSLFRFLTWITFISAIVFLVMKLTGYVDWSWLFTLSPIAATVVLNVIGSRFRPLTAGEHAARSFFNQLGK